MIFNTKKRKLNLERVQIRKKLPTERMIYNFERWLVIRGMLKSITMRNDIFALYTLDHAPIWTNYHYNNISVLSTSG